MDCISEWSSRHTSEAPIAREVIDERLRGAIGVSLARRGRVCHDSALDYIDESVSGPCMC